jgi:hypothetical protein
VKVILFGSAIVAGLQSTGSILLRNASEPVWMLVWGVVLLTLAARAKSAIVGRPVSTATRPVVLREARASARLLVETRG